MFVMLTAGGPLTNCQTDTCKHRGLCIETVDGYFCDCNLTSWSGRHCENGLCSLVMCEEGEFTALI